MKRRTRILCAAGIAAAALFCANRLAFLLSTRKNILSSGEVSTFGWRFGNIYYTKKGKGDPVLLLHGTDDRLVALSYSQRAAEVYGDRCTFVQLPGAGHIFHGGDAEQAKSYLRDFVRGSKGAL